ASRSSAMSRRPMWPAAPSAVSQSPPPQSQAALANVRSSASVARTASISPCAFATNSRTASATAKESGELVIAVRDRGVERREAVIGGQRGIGAVLDQHTRDLVCSREGARAEWGD